ncbi:MAG: hypothetical protein WD535_03235 [Thermaerobacterales bacterium]
MARQIEVSIDDGGKLKIEFSGFSGEDCFEEAERLRNKLASLGVHLNLDDIIRKSREQILLELGVDPVAGGGAQSVQSRRGD